MSDISREVHRYGREVLFLLFELLDGRAGLEQLRAKIGGGAEQHEMDALVSNVRRFVAMAGAQRRPHNTLPWDLPPNRPTAPPAQRR